MDSVEKKAPNILKLLVIIDDSIIILTFLMEKKKAEKIMENYSSFNFLHKEIQTRKTEENGGCQKIAQPIQKSTEKRINFD